jgi:hypothetical protein
MRSDNADLVLLARDGTAVKACRASLAAHTDLFSVMLIDASIANGELHEGLPAVRVDASAEAVAFILPLLHNLPAPDEEAIVYETLVESYKLAACWGAMRALEHARYALRCAARACLRGSLCHCGAQLR